MTLDRRTYQREYARRRRAAKLDIERRESETCSRRMGPGTCGGVLRWVRNLARDWVRNCPRCERREAGLCQDCDAPVEGTRLKALRCATHKRERMNEHGRAFVKRHYIKVRAKWRRYHKRVAVKKAKYKRLWRKANRDKVRAQKRRYGLRQKPRNREYHQAYRMAAEVEGRARWRTYTDRPCLTCPTIVRGRVKKCDACKDTERRSALELLAGRQVKVA